MTTQEKIFAEAQRLFATVGYGKTSVQMIIDAVGIAKGTFYHYFKSKDELLDVLLNESFRVQSAIIENEIKSMSGNGMDKLNKFYELQQKWKGGQFDLLYTVLEVMSSADNVQFIKKNQEKTIQYYAPILAHIIGQGVEEGIFETPYPEEIAEMIIRVSDNMSEEMVMLFVNHKDYEDPFTLLKRKIAVHSHCLERLIGAKEGYTIFEMVDFDMIKDFFDYLNTKG